MGQGSQQESADDGHKGVFIATWIEAESSIYPLLVLHEPITYNKKKQWWNNMQGLQVAKLICEQEFNSFVTCMRKLSLSQIFFKTSNSK